MNKALLCLVALVVIYYLFKKDTTMQEYMSTNSLKSVPESYRAQCSGCRLKSVFADRGYGIKFKVYTDNDEGSYDENIINSKESFSCPTGRTCYYNDLMVKVADQSEKQSEILPAGYKSCSNCALRGKDFVVKVGDQFNNSADYTIPGNKSVKCGNFNCYYNTNDTISEPIN